MVGNFVQGKRLAKGWKQQEMAARSRGRLTQAYISKLEGGGIGLPTRGMMEALSDVLDVPIAELYREAGVLEGIDGNGGGGSPPPAPPEDAPFAEIEAWVLALPGEAYRAGLVGARREMGDEDWEVLIRGVFRVFKDTLDMGLHQARRRR